MQEFFKNPRIADAFLCAIVAHGDQKYGEFPYFVHLLQVAGNIEDPSDDEIIAAFLHDAVEDTPVSMETIERAFGYKVGAIVNLVTKNESLSYEDNIKRITLSGNKSAIKVKYADNKANRMGDKSDMEPSRREKLEARYEAAEKVLRAALHA